jgi:hypothetical protein
MLLMNLKQLNCLNESDNDIHCSNYKNVIKMENKSIDENSNTDKKKKLK